MRLYLFFLASLLLTACNHQQPNKKDVLTVAFKCDNNTSLEIRFYPTDSKAILDNGQTSTELPQARSGSGFRYTDGVTTLLGKGDEIIVETEERAPLRCTALDPAR